MDVVAVDGEPEVPQPVIGQAQRHGRGILPPVRGTRIAGWALALLVPVNAVVVVSLWWRSGGVQDVHDTASLLVGIGRIAGLLGAYLVLVELVLLARLPALERLAGFERLTRLHRLNGFAAISLLLTHAVLITVGYALADKLSLLDELGKLISGYPGVITAIAGLAALVAVVVTSIVIVRRRLRYETWYFVHLYAYLGVALAFSHQLATGTDFVGEPAARAYWISLYVVTLAIIVVFRLGVPLARSAVAPAACRAGRRGGARRGLDRDRRRPSRRG